MPRGPKPKPEGQTITRTPVAHPWQPSPGVGWQHGDPSDRRRKYPAPPDDLRASSVAAWDAWMRSWWASNWDAADLPQLFMLIDLFDRQARGQLDVAKLTPLLDRWGITPKGRQDLRWAPPKKDAPAAAEPAATPAGRRLRVVDAG